VNVSHYASIIQLGMRLNSQSLSVQNAFLSIGQLTYTNTHAHTHTLSLTHTHTSAFELGSKLIFEMALRLHVSL